jgi:hypothetical protein
VLKSGGEKLMELFIIGIERIDIAIKVIFDPIPLVLLMTEIFVLSFDVLKVCNMFLFVHVYFLLII